MFRTLVLSAAAAGLAAGLFTAALQHVTTTPIILAAEQYEANPAGAAVLPAIPDGAVIATHGHAAEWAPQDGIERTIYTGISTALIGVGYAMVLLAAMTLTNSRIDARTGLAFGAAGFAAAALAPALGLPPELPGSATAELADRQAWWALTALATAAGLAGLLLTRRIALQIGGAVLIALPHMIGAPHPPAYASTAPAELAGHFAAASLAVSGVFWSVLGAASGAVHTHLSRSS